MGYAHYELPDGRQAGYDVAAGCDAPGCAREIHRGYDYLCGPAPDGSRAPQEYGCGKYFCGLHQDIHGCPRPRQYHPCLVPTDDVTHPAHCEDCADELELERLIASGDAVLLNQPAGVQ